jgi:hypothetical protein
MPLQVHFTQILAEIIRVRSINFFLCFVTVTFLGEVLSNQIFFNKKTISSIYGSNLHCGF